MDQADRTLLNTIQSSFPLVEEPFRRIGEEMGIPASEVIARIAASKEKNIVRQISAIFDTRKLGYKTVLVAMRLPPDRLDPGARVVNEHPGVSHNYARNGPFNLWFTLAVPPADSIEDTVEEMAGRAGAESYRLMPTIRFFKIGVNFDMVSQEGAAEDYYSPDGYDRNGGQDFQRPAHITDFEIDAIRELQEDLTLVPRPFAPMADALGITQRQLFDLAADFEQRGIMRRFSAVLHHRRAGFKANAMAVWNVPADRSVEVGAVMARSRWVTHCYERPRFHDWPYSHFTMIHAASRDKCEEVAGEISEATRIDDYMLLYSTREYKKSRVRYFV